MVNLRDKSIGGLFWSFIDLVANRGISFIIGIYLARILSPEEFGIIAILMIISTFADSIVNSGFTNALIRKLNCTREDYGTVLVYNFIASLLFYLIIFHLSITIENYFGVPSLNKMVKIYSLVIIINALAIVPRTKLIKKINFKTQSRISLISSISSGLIAIILALSNFGIWALIYQRIINKTIQTFLLLKIENWNVDLVFSKKSFKELFGFGSKLMISGFINTAYNNLYTFIIGKSYSTSILGYYSKANEIIQLQSMGVSSTISRVSYPILANFQHDNVKLKQKYRTIMSATFYLVCSAMLALISLSDALIPYLLGEQWNQSIVFLQILALEGLLYPLHNLNLNILKVKNRSDLFLKLEMIKKLVALPFILIFMNFDIEILLFALVFVSLVGFYINSYWSGKLIGYSTFEQLNDLYPSIIVGIFVMLITYVSGYALTASLPAMFLIKLVIAITSFIGISEILKTKDYCYIKSIAISKLYNQ